MGMCIKIITVEKATRNSPLLVQRKLITLENHTTKDNGGEEVNHIAINSTPGKEWYGQQMLVGAHT